MANTKYDIIYVMGKTLTQNRKAHHEYHIEESIEAGIALTGTEIKSLRAGRASLAHSFARPDKGELWLYNSHIAQYEAGNRYNHEPERPRKLLLHRDEIDDLIGKVMEKGYALVPLRFYLKGGRAKLELGLGKGKKMHDKRQSIAQRQAGRDIERAMKLRHS